jgi:diguanylate cyclase (GGDEF)-like protein/PAS domain S-box-containing protein
MPSARSIDRSKHGRRTLPPLTAAQAVRDSAARESAILESALDCIITIDHRGFVREFNPAAERTFGYARSEVLGREMAELIVPPNLRQAHRRGLAHYMSTGEGPVLGRRIEIEAMRRDGSIFSVELAISRVGVPGTPVFTAYLRDISDRVDSDRQLRAAEERYRSLVESLPAVVYLADFGATGAWQYVSPQIEGLLEFTPEAWLADPANWLRQIHPEDRELVVAREDAFRSSTRGQSASFEYRMLKRSGEVVWVRDEAVLVPVETGQPLQMRGVIVDITERKNLEDKLSRHAFYDTLTGLPNRTLFMERLEHAVARRARGSENLLAVLFLDIDDFKVINDTLGHAAGDLLLASVARRLASDARAVDTPARFGGDEFTILLEGLQRPDEALAVAERIAQHIAEPIPVGDRDLTTSVSVGIGMLVDDKTSAEDLVRQADIAMYRAKQDGKARARLYDDQMSVDAWRRLELDRELRRAIERSELRVHYQPVVDLETGAMVEVEALVRWQHPDRGLLMPIEFVPFAESNGLITQIDSFVVREACRQVRAWGRKHSNGRRISVAVNFSPREFHAPGLVDLVTGTLLDTGLEPSRLKVEITESVMMLDGMIAPSIVRSLSELGVKIAIDDFGIGYSGLDYVKRFEVNTLKIDRSFVAGLGRRKEDTAIVSAAIAFARALDLEVVAEGIENRDQLELLRELGCTSGQGFLFSPAVPPAELEAMLRERRPSLLPSPSSRRGPRATASPGRAPGRTASAKAVGARPAVRPKAVA